MRFPAYGNQGSGETENHLSRIFGHDGIHAEPIFGKDALTALHEVSYGIPRRIGATAVQAMFHSMFSEKRTVDANAVLKAKTGA